MSEVQPQHALNLDQTQQQGFVRFYKSLPEKPNTTIRFFNRVDYYTVHGDDADFAAREVFKSTSVIKSMGCEPNKLDYVVLSKGNFEIFVRDLLLVKLYRVEVYVSEGSTKSNNWVPEYKGSPGNLSQFEDILFSNADIIVDSSLIAVKFKGDNKNKVVGVVIVDINEYTFSMSEFVDDEHFTELEAIIVQMGPKECLLSSSDSPEFQQINSIMERSGVTVTLKKKSEFSSDGLIQDLNRLLEFDEGQQRDANLFPETNLELASCSLNVAIKYLELMSDQNNFEKFSFKKLDSARYVHLDAAALTALNIVPKKESPFVNAKTHSVLGLLDHCRTAHGKRLMGRWIRRPLKDKNQIEERLDIVETFIENNELRREIFENHLKRIPDLQTLIRKIAREKGTLQDCYKIFQAVERLPFLLDCLKKCQNKSVNGAFVNTLSDILSDMEKYQQLIHNTLDMEHVDQDEFFVKPSFDEDLQELKNKMDSLNSSIQGQLKSAARNLNLEAEKSVKLEYNSLLGYHFRITMKEEPTLRKNKMFDVIDTTKGSVRFTNSKLTNLNDEYTQAKSSYEDLQKNVVTEILKIAGGYSSVLWSLSELLAKLDILISFSIASCEAPIPYVRPKIVTEQRELDLKNLRHPCLELQEGVSYIPNDVHFIEDKLTFAIITGPNMGGKSTYIRSVGVACYMAHLGCFVPCDSATVPLLDNILARIGADDCQTRGLSTFMMEMIETAVILRAATKNSLVVIDELGRGTSTYEGCGIAWAIAEHLAKEVKAFSLFATHFHEITKLEEVIPNVTNLHVSAIVDEDQMTLLYQVKPGVCDKSFGIHVAKMADFPRSVVEYAEDKQRQLESHRLDTEIPNDASKEEALSIISNFVTSCGQLDLDNLSPEQLQNRITQMKNDLPKDNPVIKLLLNSTV